MRAVIPFVLVAALGCGGSTKPTTIGNSGGDGALALPAAVSDGALWTCQIEDYDPQPCKLTRGDDGWTLTKLLGSQRFRGQISFDGDRAPFRGGFFCPWGDCDQVMEVVFEREGAGDRYLALFGGTPIALRYDAADAEAYAGAGYGGLTGDER